MLVSSKKTLLFISLLVISISAYCQQNQARVIRYNDLEAIISKSSPDTLTVINFWATWCRPCIEELPSFEKLNQEYAPKKVKVILVSLDYASDLGKVNTFIAKKGLKTPVKILDESNPNSYIDKVDSKWSGSIPATLIIGGKATGKTLYERSFEYTDLKSIINPLIP